MTKRELRVPQLSPNMSQAVLIAWEKEPGDSIDPGDVLYEVETDKVVSQVEADFTGVLQRQCVAAGDSVSAGDLVAEIALTN